MRATHRMGCAVGTKGQVLVAPADGLPEGIAPGTLVFTKRVKGKLRVFPAPAVRAPLADTHGHLVSFWSGKDQAQVLANAARAGVRALAVPWDPRGDRMPFGEFRRALRGWIDAAREQVREGIADGSFTSLLDVRMPHAGEAAAAGDAADPLCLFDRIRFLAGVHPYGAPDYTDEVHETLVAALDDPLCAGIGEFGLDYHFDADDDIEAAPHDVQIACMERQLALAIERGLPVELHLRNDDADEARTAHADAWRMLDRMGVPAGGCILHCFGEDRATMERFLELGCYIAFGGAATFKRNERVREAFAACPRERLLLETDCPYMAPEPIRGVECEPAMISITATALAQDRAARTGEDPDDVLRAAWENAQQLIFAAR